MPGQGSRTIRTEEAILISLAALDDKFAPIQKPKQFCLAQSIPQSEDTGMKQGGARQFERIPKKGKMRLQPNEDEIEQAPTTKKTKSAVNTEESNEDDFSRFD